MTYEHEHEQSEKMEDRGGATMTVAHVKNRLLWPGRIIFSPIIAPTNRGPSPQEIIIHHSSFIIRHSSAD
jgi:hypothetical protein